jgi:IS5 family transposase
VVFDIKLHIDVDSKTELIHAMTTIAANVHDTNVLRQLLQGDETRIYWGQAYRGQIAVIREHCAWGQGLHFTNRHDRHRGVVDLAKARCRGLAKNIDLLRETCDLTNLLMMRHRLLRGWGMRSLIDNLSRAE